MEFKIDKIENDLTEINFDQEINVLFSFNDVSGEKTYYVQGAFKEEDGSRYFGWTKNNQGDYYRYEESNCVNFFKVEIKEGSISATLRVKPDYESNYFTGSGTYVLKLYRFTDGCKSKSDSDNFLSLKINAPPSPSPSPSPPPSPELSPSPLPLPSPSLLINPSPYPSLKPIPSLQKEATVSAQEASFSGEVLGLTEQSSEPSASPQATKKSFKLSLPAIIIIAGATLLFGSGGIMLYPRLKKNKQLE